MAEQVFDKRRPDAPEGFFEAEAAGLGWLAEAEPAGGARTVRVLSVAPGRIGLEALRTASPSRELAAAFGRALAATHGTGASAFGVPPDGYDGPTFIGDQPLTTRRAGWRSWGAFTAAERVLPYARRARERGHLAAGQLAVVERACERLTGGDLDDAEPPCRIHGDLWSGNVLWTAEGAVLIDPAAQGGHRETDLAMLQLFGLPHLDRVLDGYTAAHPLRPGWQQRVPLHQLHPLAVHAASHGPGYAAPLVDAARRVLDL